MPVTRRYLLCISVKLKNLKVNHNYVNGILCGAKVVYIRKVKKSESKSQRLLNILFRPWGCVYP